MTTIADIQRTVGVTPDGKVGPATIAAIAAALAREPVTAAVTGDAIDAVIVPHLRREEGVMASAYQDHLGYWTIGVGRLIDKRRGGRLTDREIDLLLRNDVARFRVEMASWPAWKRVEGDAVRAAALLSMCFQMGSAGLSGFKNTLALVADGEYAKAADNMLLSKWAQQTPARAKRVAAMLATGVAA